VIELMAAATAPSIGVSAVGSLEPEYPEEALIKNEQGKVTVELVVGANGKPISCKVTIPSASTALNDASCNFLLQRAGYPETKSLAPRIETQTIDWRIPPPVPIAAVTIGVVATFEIDGKGKISNCKEKKFGEFLDEVPSLCHNIAGSGGFYNFIKRENIFSSNAFIRFFFETNESQSHSNTVIVNYKRNFKMIETIFDVTPAGFVKNCQTVYSDSLLPAADLCAFMSKEYPEFKAEKRSKTPRKMRFLLDAGIIPVDTIKAQ
jgi:TonB family protein